MSIVRNFNLCLNAGTGSAPFINVSQTDRDETWLFKLYTETGERYIPSSGAIIGIKADGHGIANTGTVDSEGRVVITETEQITAAAGIAIYELSIDGLTHGTANFIVNVEKKPIDGAIMSDSDLSLISQAIDSAAVIVDVIGDGDPSEVIGEHVDAWLDNHPEATTTVLDGAITAPKINQSLWDKLLVSEEASGAVASFDDGADDVPVSSLKVALEPVQLGSGDPSPSNIRPIIAANGKNMYDKTAKNTSNGYVADKYLTNTGGEASSTGNQISEYIAVMPDTDYTLHPTAGSNLSYGFYDSTKTWLSGAKYSGASVVTAHSPANASYMRASVPVGNEDTFMIELGSSASAYQPYQGVMVYGMGENLFDASAITPNKALSSNGNLVNSAASFVTDYIPVNDKLFISYDYETLQATGNRIIGFYNANKEWLNETISYASTAKQHSYDVPADAVYMRMGCDNNYTDLIISDTGNTYPYTLGQSVYGGIVDLATGVLTVDREYVTFTDATTWTAASTTGVYYCNNATRFRMAQIPICDTFKGVSPRASSAVNVGEICLSNNNNSLIVGTEYATLDGWTAYLSEHPVGIVRKLVEPQTIQLTPQEVKTLLGYNNISSTGTVDVIYHADTQMYVEKEVNKAKSIIAGIEAEFKATKNYTTGDLLIIGDDLYKCTANIANGGTITVNTNVTKTTVAEQLIALA